MSTSRDGESVLSLGHWRCLAASCSFLYHHELLRPFCGCAHHSSPYVQTSHFHHVFVQALNCGTAHRSVTHAQVETLAASHQPVIHVKQGSTHVMVLSTLDCGDAVCTDARRGANDAEAAVEPMHWLEQRFDAMTRRMEAQRQAYLEENRQRAEQQAKRAAAAERRFQQWAEQQAAKRAAAERRFQQWAEQQAAEFQRCVHEIQHRTAMAAWRAEQHAAAAERWWRRLEALQPQLDAVDAGCAELTARLDTFTAELAEGNAELSARLDTFTAEGNARLDTVTAELAKGKAERAELTARLDTVTAELAEGKAGLAELKAQLKAITLDHGMARAQLYARARLGEVRLARVVGQ